MLTVALFLLPFNWIAFMSGARDWGVLAVFGLVVGIFDLMLLGALLRAGYLLVRYARYGASTIRFRRFPFFLGDTLEVTLPRTERVAALGRLTATLRCVQERYHVHGSGRSRRSVVVCYELYGETRVVGATPGNRGRRREAAEISISFALPAGDYGTRLGERPPRYWQLELTAEVPGVDYAASFLVPVYERHGVRETGVAPSGRRSGQ